MAALDVAVLAVVAAGLWMLWRYTYWRRQGVPQPTPLPLVGNVLDAALFRKNGGLVMTDIYHKFSNASCVGVYKFLQPALLLRDPELVKEVLVKQFHCFRDNEIQLTASHDPMLSRTPFVSVLERWKKLRADFTPMFTPAKVKIVAPTLKNAADGLVQYLEGLGHKSGRGDGAEAEDIVARYAANVTASVVFGLDGAAFGEEPSAFMDLGYYKLLGDSWFTGVRFSLLFIFPAYMRLLKMRYVPVEVENFFKRVVKQVAETRKGESKSRPDLFDRIINSKSEDHLDDDALTEAAGKVVAIFVESIKTPANIITGALVNLAIFPDTQKKLRKELLEAFPDRNMDVDIAVTLPYLDSVILETLRIYEQVPLMTKVCTSPTTLYPEGQSPISVERGCSIVIPLHALQHDPKYFPDPDRFEPDRHRPEAAATRHKFAFLPVGEGPRTCVGWRYGLAVAKAAVAAVILNFDLEVSPKQAVPPRRDVLSAFFTFEGGVWLRFVPR